MKFTRMTFLVIILLDRSNAEGRQVVCKDRRRVVEGSWRGGVTVVQYI